jgi:hypothetical protein
VNHDICARLGVTREVCKDGTDGDQPGQQTLCMKAIVREIHNLTVLLADHIRGRPPRDEPIV